MKFLFVLIFFLDSFYSSLLAVAPIVPADVFTDEERQDILKTNNFFHYLTIDDETPIWMGTRRKYSQPFLEPRTSSFSLKEILHRTLTDGFPIQYAIEQLYRAKMGIHSQLGNILPQLNMGIGEGASFLLSSAFSSVFAFMLPANWLKLGNEDLIYKATKLLLLKTVLDQILAVKLLYLDLHQLLTNYEILNYYFLHLQLLGTKYKIESRQMLTVLGQFGTLGGDVAIKRTEISLAFDRLARIMALEKLGNYSVSTLNIEEIEDFPQQIHELGTHKDLAKDRETFLSEIVRESLELKIAKRFYKVSKLNVGITATGGVLSNVDKGPGNPNNDARFALTLGYGNIPNLLIAKSLSRTARLDVQSGYLELLTAARTTLDLYSSAIGCRAEARRALSLNRQAFKKNLEFLANNDSEPDPYFMFSLLHLVDSEFKLNASLHDALRAQAAMDRYLLKDKENALRYLPSKDVILKEFSKLKGEGLEELRREEEIDKVFEKIKTVEELKRALYKPSSHPKLRHYSSEEIERAVKFNIGNLLYSKARFYKHREFFRLLSRYIQERKIELTQMEHYLLAKKKASLWTRTFHSKSIEGDGYMHSLDFKNFVDTGKQ